MLLTNIIVNGETHLAVKTQAGLQDVTAGGFTETLKSLIDSGDLNSLKSFHKENDLPIINNPVYGKLCNTDSKVVCVGLNYLDHATGVNMATCSTPILFSKYSDAIAANGECVVLPPWETSYDYEAELVIVIGKTAWNVSKDDAAEYIFGYTCGNDLSCREAQMRSGQWLIGKTMPGFAPCGPFIATADSFDYKNKSIKSYVNGELRQDGNTNEMIFDCETVVSYASKYIKLQPGDLIFTGTPSGVALENKTERAKWLVAGDKVDVVIDGIGTLVNVMI